MGDIDLRSKTNSANIVFSGSTGPNGPSDQTSSSSFVTSPTLSVVIATVGRPVHIMLISDGTGSGANAGKWAVNSGVTAQMQFLRDGSPIAVYDLTGPFIAVSALSIYDVPTAASHTYQIQYRISGGSGTTAMERTKMVAIELN